MLKTLMVFASVTASLGLSGCANVQWGRETLSSPLVVNRTDAGFSATQRAGVDKLANDPTWETIRRQRLAEAVKLAGICQNGVEGVERRAIAGRTTAIGTVRDLTYTGRCK
jgi:hypothetical protein